jgi:hypothetical protein
VWEGKGRKGGGVKMSRMAVRRGVEGRGRDG